MKIALLTNGIYPFNMGGMQKHSYYLARYMAQRKVQVDIYLYKQKEDIDEAIKNYFEPKELKYLAFHEINLPSSAYFPGHYLFNTYRFSCNVYQKLKDNLANVDFIYIQGFTGWKLLKEKKSGKNIPPVGVNFHGLEMFQIAADVRSKLERYLFRYPAKFCLREADIAFSLGGKLTDIIENKIFNTKKVWETPIGIEEKWLNERPDSSNKRRKFIFIGRYERRKGIQELNEAIKKIHKSYEFDVEFIGPIPKKNRLKLPNCKYHGAVYDEDKIIEIVSDGDILVSPSYSEGMPTVILEAMSRGLAVIATDVGAVSELVSSENGWLINPASIPDLKGALMKAIELPDDELMKKKQYALALIEKKFTWNKVIDITLNQIKEYINKASTTLDPV